MAYRYVVPRSVRGRRKYGACVGAPEGGKPVRPRDAYVRGGSACLRGKSRVVHEQTGSIPVPGENRRSLPRGRRYRYRRIESRPSFHGIARRRREGKDSRRPYGVLRGSVEQRRVPEFSRRRVVGGEGVRPRERISADFGVREGGGRVFESEKPRDVRPRRISSARTAHRKRRRGSFARG